MSMIRSYLLALTYCVFLFLQLSSITSVAAQDRRQVSEPRLPALVCATLASSAQSKDDTRRLQNTINQCQQGAAVRLVVGAAGSRFVSGPLIMKSGVTLWLDRGAVLAATTDPLAYDKNGHCGTLDDKGNGCRPFIMFKGTEGGGIVGDGTIDGQGGHSMVGHDETWWQLARRAQTENSKQNVPRLIEIDHAHDITFYKVMLHDAPNFHVAMNRVQGATFWAVRIDTPADARNTDGIDPGASEDITISHSFIRTGDDNVALKAGRGGATRYISLIDNHFYWGHGLSIGSETIGGVSDVLVRGLTLDGTTSGLRIKSDDSRGGLVSNVYYEHVCMRNNRRPIDFDTHYDVKAQGKEIPVFRGIVLHDVVGQSGDLVIRGYDNMHQLGISLYGVSFAPNARWQIKFARIKSVSSSLPGLTGNTRGSDADTDCAGGWVSFPDAEGGQSASKYKQSLKAAKILRVGPGQSYATVQKAADVASEGDTLLIAPGIYREVVHLRTPGLHLIGQGTDADAVVIEADHSAGDSGGTSHSATVFAEADGIEIDRLTIANRFHDEHPNVKDGAQAVALSATGDKQRYVGLHLISYQDTLYAGSHGCTTEASCKPSRQYYQDDRIDGAVDVIFGDALAFFERATLLGVDREQVTMTAQSRASPNQPSGYVFHDCTVTAAPQVASISLGRPWRDYSTVSYVGCMLDKRVIPRGFTEWQGQHRLNTARYLIINARGPGAASGTREPWLLKPDTVDLVRLSTPQSFFDKNLAER